MPCAAGVSRTLAPSAFIFLGFAIPQVRVRGDTAEHGQPCMVLCQDLHGNRVKREWMFLCVWLAHFAMQQKLTQHCKSTLPQVKHLKMSKQSLCRAGPVCPPSV